MHIVVCDDEPSEVKKICSLLQALCTRLKLSIELRGFTQYKEFLSYIAKVHADIVFLDICMGEHNGLEAARILRNFNQTCTVIFVTSSRDYALDAFAVMAAHYLVKPVDSAKLLEALRRSPFVQPPRKTLTIVSDYVNTTIDLDDISYIDIISKVTQVHLASGKTFASYTPISTLAERLSNEPRFIPCHRSIIVNADYIQSIENDTIRLTDRTELPLPRKRYAAVRGAFREYIFAKTRSI